MNLAVAPRVENPITAGTVSHFLTEYNRSGAVYHCPADKSTVADVSGNMLGQLRNCSDNMSQSLNGYPESNLALAHFIPSFKKLAWIQAPDPTSCVVFINEHQDTLVNAVWHTDGLI